MTPAASINGLSFPYVAVGAKAAAAAINKKGGIDGHPIQIDVCDNLGSPNQSAVCGRKAKSNGDIAVVGSWDLYGGPQITPVLQAEGIPDVGAIAVSPTEVTSPISYPFDTGAVMGFFATPAALHEQGCKNAVVMLPTQTATPAQIAGIKAIAAKDHFAMHVMVIPTGQADVTPQVSNALAVHPDCESYLGDAQTNLKLIVGLRQAGYKGKIVASEGSLLPQFLKSLGKAADGIIAINTALDPGSSDPLVTQFRTQVISYTGSQSAAATDLNEFAQNAWSAVRLVDLALTGTGTYTSAELLKKLPTMCDVNVGNYYPHLNFCKPVAKSTLYPRVYNDQWRYFVAKNGVYVPTDNQWHDYSDTVPAS